MRDSPVTAFNVTSATFKLKIVGGRFIPGTIFFKFYIAAGVLAHSEKCLVCDLSEYVKVALNICF